jgi:hypothetical protein
VLRRCAIWIPAVLVAAVVAVGTGGSAVAGSGSGAASAAGSQVSPEDLGKLGDILREGTGYKARVQAARAMGMLRTPDALPHLLRGLREDPDQLVRAACAWALGSINHPAAVEALHKAAGSEVELVQQQAQRALDFVVSAFPGNLKSVRDPIFVDLDGLKDEALGKDELAAWIKHCFLAHLVNCTGVETGDEMDIEEDGATPDVVKSGLPQVRVALAGGIKKLGVPEGRAAGPVAASVNFQVRLVPVPTPVFTGKGYDGRSPFAGGPAPADSWTDDPLVESQKGAVRQAVDKGFADLATYLGLTVGK